MSHPIQLIEITYLDNKDHETLSSRLLLNDLPKKNYENVVHRKATLESLDDFSFKE